MRAANRRVQLENRSQNQHGFTSWLDDNLTHVEQKSTIRRQRWFTNRVVFGAAGRGDCRSDYWVTGWRQV